MAALRSDYAELPRENLGPTRRLQCGFSAHGGLEVSDHASEPTLPNAHAPPFPSLPIAQDSVPPSTQRQKRG